MAMIQKHYENQLQFNLDVAPSLSNMAARFQRPEPIVIEKCSGGPPFGVTQTPATPAFELSSISEDRLSAAVKLAKRDLEKKKLEESFRQEQAKEAKEQKGSKARDTKKVKARSGSVLIGRKRQAKDKNKVVLVKEREIGKETKTAKTQTSQRPVPTFYVPTGNRAVVHIRDDLPAMSMSPPTRDVGPSRVSRDVRGTALEPPGNREDQHLREIKRLRKDVQKYLQQMQDLERKARLGQLGRPAQHMEPEDQRREAVRVQQQATRSARTLYALQKQVQDIQNELNTLSSATSSQRKMQIMGRLAAAHRAAARMLQTCISTLPSQVDDPGFARSCRELTLLVRQLSLCCAQLSVYGDTDMPDDVMELVNEATEFSNKLDKELETAQRRSPASRQLFPEEHRRAQPEKDERVQAEKRERRRPVTKERVPEVEYRELRVNNDAKSKKPELKQWKDGVNKKFRDQAVETSPEREQALRAGISALMRAADSPAPTPRSPRQQTRFAVPRLDLPVSPRPARGRTVTYGRGKEGPPERRGNKGLLLPPHLQRERAQRPVHVDEAHFAEPTFSSKMRQVLPEEHPQKRALASPPHSPRRDGSPRASARSGTSYHGPYDNIRRDIVRQVRENRERSRQGTPRKQYLSTADIVAEAERQIQEKLQPLLQKAQDIRNDYDGGDMDSNTSLRHRLSEKAVETVEGNMDVLADMILHDVLGDTAVEMQRLEEDAQDEIDALSLYDAPDVEVMLQRLKEMEAEQENIRRRYTAMAYDDDFAAKIRAATTGGTISNEPTTPPPIEVTCTTDGPATHFTQHGSSCEADIEPIRFTKPAPAITTRGPLHMRDLEQPQAHPSPRQHRIPIFLSRQLIASIRENRDRYTDYLKNTAHQAVGRFDPWSVVEQIADEILADCLKDVGDEIDSISADIADHVYKTEFTEPSASRRPVISPTDERIHQSNT